MDLTSEWTAFDLSQIDSSTREGDIRFLHLIKPLKMHQLSQISLGDVVLLSASDDRGVIKNNGRAGAHQGPLEIRKALYRYTPHCENLNFNFYDLGEPKFSTDLSKDQQNLKTCIEKLLSHGATVILCGGGHDWGFCDSAALAMVSSKESKTHCVLNLDAHLDFRPYPQGPHSGSPFRQLMEIFPKTKLCELGLQYICNSPKYVREAKSKGVFTYFLEDLHHNNQHLFDIAKNWFDQNPSAFHSLSIDMDGFEAMAGVSASYPFGISPRDGLKTAFEAGKNSNLRTLGIFETSPQYDQNHHTSRLAAQLISEFIRGRSI